MNRNTVASFKQRLYLDSAVSQLFLFHCGGRDRANFAGISAKYASQPLYRCHIIVHAGGSPLETCPHGRFSVLMAFRHIDSTAMRLTQRFRWLLSSIHRDRGPSRVET